MISYDEEDELLGNVLVEDSKLVPELVFQEVEDIQNEIAKRARLEKYLVAPEEWIGERLQEKAWSKQVEILHSIVKNRYTAVPSCFGSGKSWTAARAAAFWIDCHPRGDAFVVSTARSGRQVKAILWRELHRAHRSGELPGRLNQTEWWLNVDGEEEMVAFGMKPDDYDPTSFQGIHARYVLVILDEAAGISSALFEAATSLIVNEDSRILAIGNPEDSASEFAAICKPGSGWNVIRIPAWVTPNFTGEVIPSEVSAELISNVYVEEKRRKWGEDSPMWAAKIEAEFPESQEMGLFPIKWVREAQDRSLEPGEPWEMGVDVGGGGDRTVNAFRQGPRVRIIRKDNVPNTMMTCGNVISDRKHFKATKVKIDMIGIGRGLVERGQELEEPFEGINVAQEPADKESFVNLRAEAYWGLRERFESGNIDIDPDDDDLAEQLVAIRYKRTSSGKIQIESKDEMKRRLKRANSPDELDAVMLSFLQLPPPPKKPHGATWGRR